MAAEGMSDAGAPVEIFNEIDSTMAEARRRAEHGAIAPVWLLALAQSAGRGRRGRPWASIDGNLMATYLAPNARPPAELALLGFAAGLAVAEALEARLGDGRVRLKWPNDVLIDAAKAAGLMLDSGAGWMALGLGVNLAGAPDGLDQPAASLAGASDAPPPAPLTFLGEVRPRLAHWDARLAADGFAPLREAWLARAHGLGETTRVAVGEAMIEGRFAGLSPRGELELDAADGRVRIAAGDILFSSIEAA